MERDIQNACTGYLELDGWRSLQTDPVSDRRRGKGFGEAGMADHLYIRYPICGNFKPRAQADAEVMWIEWKRMKGKNATKATQHQLDWHAAERARGALTLIAGVDFPASIEGFIKWYEQSGLNRRMRVDRRTA
jgi:hypothetical protein